MKFNLSKLFTALLAAAACLTLTAQARAFWTDGGRGGGAQEQLGLSEDAAELTALTVHGAAAAESGYAAGGPEFGTAHAAARKIELTPLQKEQLLTLARYVYGRGAGKRSLTAGHTFSTHELEVAGDMPADGSFQLGSIRFRKHDGISDNAEQTYYSEFTMYPDFTVDLRVTRRDYYTGAAETRLLNDDMMAMLMTEISVWLDEGRRWVRFPTPEDLRLKEIEKRAIELEKLYNKEHPAESGR